MRQPIKAILKQINYLLHCRIRTLLKLLKKLIRRPEYIDVIYSDEMVIYNVIATIQDESIGLNGYVSKLKW